MTGAIGAWLANKATTSTMILAAQKGFPALGREVYLQLPPDMVRGPSTVLQAYEQAIYFLAVAVRRADATNEAAGDPLLLSLEQFIAEADTTSEGAGVVCRTTGFFCPGGSAGVLQRTIDAIEASKLNVDDRARIVAILKANRRAVMVRQAIPYATVAGLAVVGLLWFRGRRRQT
jgi:hypothetical protein